MLEIIIFTITFYFTILRFITQTKLFDVSINNINDSLDLKYNNFWTIIYWLMWFYQIYFWFNYFNILA